MPHAEVRFVKLPIRDQILWPLIGLLLVAVAANALFSAWWMSNRSLHALEARQQQILGVLEQSSFPLSSSVMEKLNRLTGDELIVWDNSEHRVVVGTLESGVSNTGEFEWSSTSKQGSEPQRRVLNGKTYVVRAGRIRGMPPYTLLVLTSDETLRTASREAIWPPLAVGMMTIVLSIPLTLLLVSGWVRRIRLLEQHVGTIARGEFGLVLPAGTIDDELSRLVMSINSMSQQLRTMQEQLVRGERTRLVAQLTAGFAHQLRNGLAGAKLAIQLHESRCAFPAEASLAVAANQLALVEEEVQGLLSLGKADMRSPAPVDPSQVVQAVANLVRLSCEHRGVTLCVESEGPGMQIDGFADGLRAALLNLTLNAIDAAGAGGNVWLRQMTVDRKSLFIVEDDGPGPPMELEKTLFDPFVTSKPEGVGLGLAVATSVAHTHRGSLGWHRVGERTRFELALPLRFTNEEGPV